MNQDCGRLWRSQWVNWKTLTKHGITKKKHKESALLDQYLQLINDFGKVFMQNVNTRNKNIREVKHIAQVTSTIYICERLKRRNVLVRYRSRRTSVHQNVCVKADRLHVVQMKHCRALYIATDSLYFMKNCIYCRYSSNNFSLRN